MEIYKETADYAKAHGELDKYRASMQESRACKDAIEEAIAKSFDGMRLPKNIVQPIVERFGKDRVQFVLANTVQIKEWDGRFSRSNKAWANSFDIPGDRDRGGEHRFTFAVTTHPYVLNGFIDMVRKELREKERPSVMDALKAIKPDHPKSASSHKHEVVR